MADPNLDPAPSAAPFLGAPPSRTPAPATTVAAVRGKRVILSRPDGFVYDVRAVSEVFLDPLGEQRVQVCSEQAFYRWMLNNVPPDVETYPAVLVWVE
jgi:hypothetical protein